MVEAHTAFLTWAAAYHTKGLEQRGRASHGAWLAERAAPVIRLDSAKTTPQLTGSVLQALGR